MDVEDEAEFTSQILTEISLVKGEMMDLYYYYSKNCSEELFKKLYQGYEKAMMDKGLLDFDDMLVLCYELFTQRKDILTAWQNKYRYIPVSYTHLHITMIGGWLGNLDQVLDVPYLAVWAFTLCLTGLALKIPGEQLRMSGRHRVWTGFLCAACAGLTMLSMLIRCV